MLRLAALRQAATARQRAARPRAPQATAHLRAVIALGATLLQEVARPQQEDRATALQQVAMLQLVAPQADLQVDLAEARVQAVAQAEDYRATSPLLFCFF